MNKFKLLVFIDDDEATNFYNKYIVTQSGICEQALFFEKAEDALLYFQKLKDENRHDTIPDAIFLDINMPKIDGWMFLEKYAKINLKKSPVVLMLTTSLSPSDKVKGEGNSMVYKFLTKPLTNENLMELIKELS